MMQYSTHLVLVWSDSYWLNYILVNVFHMLLEFSQETFPNTYMFPVCFKRVIKRGLMGKEQRHVGRHPLSVDPCVPQAAWKCSEEILWSRSPPTLPESSGLVVIFPWWRWIDFHWLFQLWIHLFGLFIILKWVHLHRFNDMELHCQPPFLCRRAVCPAPFHVSQLG